jgi:hypothetical protein
MREIVTFKSWLRTKRFTNELAYPGPMLAYDTGEGREHERAWYSGILLCVLEEAVSGILEAMRNGICNM